jgi:transglutaminase-like putative cysteine protease
MHQKVCRAAGVVALTFAFLLEFSSAAVAQPTNVSFQPVGAWVQPVAWTPPPQPARNADSDGTRYLLFERQEHPAHKETFTRIVQLMENETGVQDSGSLTFRFDPSFQDLILHQVQIHRAGNVLNRLDPAKLKFIQPETGLSQHIYTGEQSALLFVEDLRVGDLLEFAYTIRGSNPILGDHFATRFVVQSSQPVERQRFRVLWPAAKPLQHRQHLTPTPPTTTTAADQVEYLWDFAELAAITYEDLLPAGYELYPYLELSDFTSWREVVDWAVPLYDFTAQALPADLQELIQQWRTATTPEARGRLALQFVQDDLRYTGLELGPDSYQPAPPADTFQLRYGDCKGKVALLCAILRELDIEAYPALVNTYSRGAVARRLPSPFAFNHVIAKVSVNGQVVWVDPTRTHQGGTLPERYLPAYGVTLVIQPGEAELEELPAPAGQHGWQRITSTYQMDDYDSPATLWVASAYHGSEADDLRESLARNNLESMARTYLNFYSRYYPEIESLQPISVADDRVGNVLRLTEKYRIPNIWKTNVTPQRWEVLFPAEALHNVLPVPNTRIRKLPLRVPHPLRREHEIIVNLPADDWNIGDLEERVAHDAFTFHYQRQHSGRVVQFNYHCETKAGEVAPENVAGYLQKLDAMDDLIGDTLFRPQHQSQSFLARINWLMVILGCFAASGTAIGCIWIWYATRIKPDSLPPALPPRPDEMRLQGLGGWLILVGIGLCLGPVWRTVSVAQSWEVYLSMEVWQIVATPSGESFHPLYGPLLIFELLANILLVGFNLLVIALFFARRAAFPKTFIIWMFSAVLFLVVNEVLGAQIPAIAADAEPGAKRQITQILISTCMWSAYMLKSRRVKLTFVR